MRTLTFRIAAQILLVVLTALSLIAYLNYSNFDKTQRQLAESRILVTAGEVKRAVSGALELGLSLDEISNLTDMLNQGLQSRGSTGVEDYAILNKQGALIATSAANPPDWSAVGSWPIERQQKETLRSLATDRFAVGIPLSNAFGDQSGWLIVAYDGSDQIKARGVMRKKIFEDLAISALIASLAMIVGISLITRPFIRNLNAVLKGVSGLPEPSAPDNPIEEIKVQYQAFMAETASTGADRAT